LKIQVTLQFASLEELWAYKSMIHLTTFEIEAGSKILTFEGTEEQIELAASTCNAVVVYSELESKTA
jgi:hypothetical protein